MPRAALQRHSAAPCAALRAIDASVERRGDALELAWRLAGDIGRLRIPAPRPPRFADGLWRHTCCEIFIARAGLPGYREFNFAPSGEWAEYDFRRYREAALPAGESAAPEISVRRDADRLVLETRVAAPSGGLSIALAAVIEDRDGALSYWALRHAPGEPDFHHPDAFALELDEARP